MWQSHIRRCLVALGYRGFFLFDSPSIFRKILWLPAIVSGCLQDLAICYVSSERKDSEVGKCYVAHVT